ncbi:MAG TPA: UDP-N-acetylenolpyruvoylglucosamine reductase, partial [Clostridiales bacterium]|nr:UDP-N-acetylenolpyruvoylglucosamine reductase [Clostridiales bacterium]
AGNPEEIRALMADYAARRSEKQPLDFASAGSTFKRPPGQYAGALIEQCGLKGKRMGGAQVSEKHAGFIINTGEATSSDLYALLLHVQRTVAEQTGITLEPEVKIWGEFK